MNATPVVGDAASSGLARLWRLVIDPAPGRLENTTRVVILVLIVVTIGETFRIPEIAISAYVVLFVSRAEAASTALTALIAGIAVIVAIFCALAVLMLTLSEPALRIPMIAAVTFAAMFLARTGGELAPALFAAGFIVAYGLTLGDEVLGFALMPATAANTAPFALPEIAFISPEEALVQFLLWLALAVVIPIALVIIANLLTGRDPALLLRAALTERLRAAADYCENLPGANRRIDALAWEGTGELLKLRHLSGLLKKTTPRAPIIGIQRLLLLLLAINRIGIETEKAELAPVARFCRETAQALADDGAALPCVPRIALTGSAAPLASQIAAALHQIRDPAQPAAASPASPRGLLAPDAFTNPEYVQLALKVTLAVMLCYFAQNMLDWPGIHTCVITCFFVSLGTVGETAQKAALRLSGCIVGGALGIGTILLLMPLMTDLGELLLVVASVTFVAAWIGFGSEQIAYAGWQIGLAFYLSTFQGFGPTLDMETARDRIIGIALGNIIIFVVFTAVWPVSAAGLARRHLVEAVQHLAALFGTEASAADHRTGFAEAMRSAQSVMANEPFEDRVLLWAPAGPPPIDRRVLTQVRSLLVPILVILDLRSETPSAPDIARYSIALSAWLRRAAAWIRDGTGAEQIIAALPRPPATSEPLRTWLGVLDHDIREIAPPSMQPARTVPASLPRGLSVAAD